jgi:hypothetical protein
MHEAGDGHRPAKARAKSRMRHFAETRALSETRRVKSWLRSLNQKVVGTLDTNLPRASWNPADTKAIRYTCRRYEHARRKEEFEQNSNPGSFRRATAARSSKLIEDSRDDDGIGWWDSAREAFGEKRLCSRRSHRSRSRHRASAVLWTARTVRSMNLRNEPPDEDRRCG